MARTVYWTVWLLRYFIQPILAAQNSTQLAKPIIIDTDIMTDCDDVGALAIANVFHNCGYCDLRGVMINTHSRYGSLAASAVNAYYGNGHVPIGALRPLTNDTFLDTWEWTLSEYAGKIAHNWPRDLSDANDTQTPLDLYTSILEKAANDSITIISIGFLTNIATLLQTAHGPDLITSKVHELVIMGGQYPSGWEYNFGGVNPDATKYLLENWPRSIPITFSGFELGAQIFSGEKLADHAPHDSPVLAAYQWYVGRCGTVRESWDPVTVLYGILGLEGFAGLGLKTPFVYANEFGYNRVVAANGSNAWVDDESVRNQHWLRLADRVTNVSVAAMLTQWYAHDPIDQTCY